MLSIGASVNLSIYQFLHRIVVPYLSAPSQQCLFIKKNEVLLHLITYVIMNLVKRYNKQTSYFRCGRIHSIASLRVPVRGGGGVHSR